MLPILEKLKEHLETDDESTSLPALVIAELECGCIKLSDVVEETEIWLTSPDREKRKRATQLLADLLTHLPKDFLSQAETQHFIAFFCARLPDHYSITPCSLAALAALTSMKKVEEDAGQQILFSLQQNITCQALSVSSRRHFYTIFHNIYLNNKPKVVKGFGNELLFGLISGMDSESDPRNLVYLFSFLPSILEDIPLGSLAEDVFSVLECYFPVDYNPADDKDTIKRSDLAAGLECCLAASKELGEFSLKMIIDKLDSSLKIAQLDSLSLLTRGCKIWEVGILSKYLAKLWDEVGNCVRSGDSELSAAAVQALLSILQAFSSAPLGKEETQAFSSLLDNISASSYEYLAEPSLSRFSPTLSFLVDVASVSPVTALYFIPSVIKQLTALAVSSEENTSVKDTVLRNLVSPLHLYTQTRLQLSDSEEAVDVMDRCLEMLLSCINDTTCRCPAYDCLAVISSFLTSKHRQTLLLHIKASVPHEPSKQTRESCSKVVSALAEKYPEEVEKYLLSALELPGKKETETERLGEMVTWIANGEKLTATAINLLLHCIHTSPDSQSSLQLITILRDYSEKCNARTLHTMGRECDIAVSMLQRFLTQPPSIHQLRPSSHIITNIMRVFESEEQSLILNIAYDLIWPRLTHAPSSLAALVLLEGFIAGLDRSVRVKDSVALCGVLIERCESLEAHTSAAITLALLVNKTSNDIELDEILDLAWRRLKRDSECEENVNLCMWICKALLLRGHPSADQWMEQMIEYVFHDTVATQAANGLRFLLHQDPYLSKHNHANIQVLYRQRVFDKVNILLSREAKASKSALLSIVYILRNSPPSLLLANLDKVRGVLRDCLETQERDVEENALHILQELVKTCSPSQAALLAHSFLPACLKIARSSPYMAVRQGALQSIYLYACHFKPEDIIPYKKMVVDDLINCLDDKKRLVRQEAVRARSKWFTL